MSAPKIAVVVVTKDAYELLRRNLEVLAAETARSLYDLFIVDNGSRDRTVAFLKAVYPQAWLSCQKTNLGFARAVNIALKQILQEKAHRYILLLNVDIEVQGRAVEKMLSFLEQCPEAAGVGPALILPDGSYQVGAGGYLPSLSRAAAYFFGFSTLFPGYVKGLFLEQRRGKRSNEAIEVDWLSGACLLARRQVFEEVGLLDETFFFSVEDIEWGWRLRKKGFKLFYWPEVAVLHHHGLVRESFTPFDAAWVPNLFQLVKREKGRKAAFLVRGLAIKGFMLRLIFWTGRSLLARDKVKKSLARKKQKQVSTFLRASLSPSKYHVNFYR